MQLSKNFSLVELTSSETAARKGLNNTPDEQAIESLKALCENVLQPLREWYGKPINVTSGYRSPKVNKAIGGSGTSEHCFGKAADFTIQKDDYRMVFQYIKENLKFRQLIWEFGNNDAPQWIHVSFDATDNKKQVLRAKKINGGTSYVPY